MTGEPITMKNKNGIVSTGIITLKICLRFLSHNTKNLSFVTTKTNHDMWALGILNGYKQLCICFCKWYGNQRQQNIKDQSKQNSWYFKLNDQ